MDLEDWEIQRAEARESFLESSRRHQATTAYLSLIAKVTLITSFAQESLLTYHLFKFGLCVLVDSAAVGSVVGMILFLIFENRAVKQKQSSYLLDRSRAYDAYMTADREIKRIKDNFLD